MIGALCEFAGSTFLSRRTMALCDHRRQKLCSSNRRRTAPCVGVDLEREKQEMAC